MFILLKEGIFRFRFHVVFLGGCKPIGRGMVCKSIKTAQSCLETEEILDVYRKHMYCRVPHLLKCTCVFDVPQEIILNFSTRKHTACMTCTPEELSETFWLKRQKLGPKKSTNQTTNSNGILCLFQVDDYQFHWYWLNLPYIFIYQLKKHILQNNSNSTRIASGPRKWQCSNFGRKKLTTHFLWWSPWRSNDICLSPPNGS